MAGDLNYYQKSKADDNIIINILNQENDEYLKLTNINEEKIKNLTLDKNIYKIRGDKFENYYSTCNGKLIQCYDTAPSRVTWFGAGMLSTIILGLTTIILIK